MSGVEVQIAHAVSARVLGRSVEMVEKHKKQLYRDASRLAEKLAKLLEEYVKEHRDEFEQASYLRMALTILSAVRMYMYILAESFYVKLDKNTPDMPGKKLAYARTINEALEAAWALSQEVIICPECSEEEKQLYM